MYLNLLRRTRNVQRTVKTLWLPCALEQVTLPDGHINEQMLLRIIPAGWLPAKPSEILLSIAYPWGSQGLKRLTAFRPWARHFDCYVLELWRDEPR